MDILHRIARFFAYYGFLGRMLRFPLRLIPKSAQVPILSGPLRGCRWIVGSGHHSYWFGSYELPTQKRFCQTAQMGWVIYDIGAHVGFYSLLGAVLVGDAGYVIAFEPNPRNVCYLRKHIALNALTNITVSESAVTNISGIVDFSATSSDVAGHVFEHSEDTFPVVGVRLDDIFAEMRLPLPDMVKMDVEGEEARVLEGAKSMLSASHPIIFLSTHGPNMLEHCWSILEELDYDIEHFEKAEEGSYLNQLIATPRVVPLRCQ